MRALPTTILAALLLVAGPAAAEDPPGFEHHLTDDDRGRLARFEAALGRAAVQAVKGADMADLANLRTAIGGDPQALPAEELVGDWRCRTIKVGGNLPLVVYSFFDCRIERAEAGLRLVKSTGSQRTSGRLFGLDGPAYGFAGALHYSDEEPGRYGADAERDMVGRLVPTGAERMWLGLPEPRVESVFDVLEMVRG